MASPAHKAYVGGAMLVVLAAYALLSIGAYLSYHWSYGWNRASLARAAAIDPWNAEPWRRMGHLDLFSSGDSDRAAREEQQALRRDPRDAYAWLELAFAQQALGDRSQAEQALRQAFTADPTTPDYLLTAAQVYLSAGNQAQGLSLLRSLADAFPDSLSAVVPLAWRATRSAPMVVATVIPANAEGQLLLLRLLSEQEREADADWLWAEILREKFRFAPALAAPYVEILLQHNRGARALSAWQALAGMNPALAEERTPGNLVTNPGFEADSLGALLDWRYQNSATVAPAIDSGQAHSGRRSLRLQFNGAVARVGIAQYVPLAAGTAYELSGYYHTQEVEGAGGLCWAVVDAASGTVLAETPPLAAAADWQPFTAKFQMPAGDDLARLELRRIPAGDELRGSVWFDDLAIRPR